MKFEEGTDVKTADGDKVGTVDRIVIDPVDQEVTHIVVEKGFLFTEDHVIPVENLQEADENTVTLVHSVEDLDQFPQFEETYYVNPNRDYLPPQWGGWAGNSLYFYPPVGVTPSAAYYPGLGYPWADGYKHTSRNIPSDTVTVDEGTSVKSINGDDVGNVEKAFTDEDGNLTHILISKGMFFTTERLVPIHWVKHVDENEIQLSVATNLVEDLPDYND